MNETVDMPRASPVLWKDIWWIKSIVLVVTGVSCLLMYKILIKILKTFGSYKKRPSNNSCAESLNCCSALPNTTTKTTSDFVGGSTQLFNDCEPNCPLGTLTEMSARNRKDILECDDPDHFYDLAHHGIKFYDDNVSSSGIRLRRQRMHSTVAETSLVSMVRQRQRPGPTVLNPPAFPKLDNLMEEAQMNNTYEFKDNLDGHLSAGDMRFYTQAQPCNGGRLTTVTEEETFQESDSYSAQGQVDKESEATVNPFKRPVGNNNDSRISSTNNNAYNTKAIPENKGTTSCPSLVTDKCAQDSAVSNVVKCSVCESRIRCLCKNCSRLCYPQTDNKKYAYTTTTDDEDNKKYLPTFNTTDDEDTNQPQDYPEIEDNFIDENFEDMESIVSDEIITITDM